jgi:dienelactone hydrolase
MCKGWLTLPKDYDPAKKYPLIVVVHGGPASATVSRWGGGFGHGVAAFSALGYFVLQPNPRGSFGQGEEFTQANRKDFGYGDLRDILAGVDAVEAAYPVDPNRVGLTGWSYGGFMAMFAVTQTQRFKAAVAGAGISNWQSYYGENSIDQWMTPYFGAPVYDDPAVYAKSSAINFIKNVTTPTLVVVGERDGECPAPQSYEFWHALSARHVPTRLVVYPNEGHMFADPAHWRDVMERAAEWFARYLAARAIGAGLVPACSPSGAGGVYEKAGGGSLRPAASRRPPRPDTLFFGVSWARFVNRLQVEWVAGSRSFERISPAADQPWRVDGPLQRAFSQFPSPFLGAARGLFLPPQRFRPVAGERKKEPLATGKRGWRRAGKFA